MNQLRATDYRADARMKLGGKWGINVGIVFVNILISGLVSEVFSSFFKSDNVKAGAAFLVTLVFTFAISGGEKYAALFTTRGGKPTMDMLFKVFSKELYVPLFLINLIQQFVGMLLNLVIYLPVLILGSGTLYINFLLSKTDPIASAIGNTISTGTFAFVTLLVTIIAFLISALLTGIFSMAIWAKMDFPELSAWGAVSYAWYLLKDRMGTYIILQVSFIGWAMLGTIALLVGLLWVVAYQQVSNAGFYDQAVQEKGSPSF